MIMARYDAAHKPATRARILEASERLLKREGVDKTSVEAVMREAGLTVGGFYAHFASKEALARETLLQGVEKSFARLTAGLEHAADRTFLATLIDRYLAQADDPDLAHACPLTLLLPEVARSDPAFRTEFATRTAALVRAVESRFPEVQGRARRETALAVFASLAGAVAMARAAATPRARRTISDATRNLLFSSLGLEGAEASLVSRGSRARVRSRR